MRDFLVWYNNRDVVPFLEAIDKQFAFYKQQNIDMFKDGVSVPGRDLVNHPRISTAGRKFTFSLDDRRHVLTGVDIAHVSVCLRTTKHVAVVY